MSLASKQSGKPVSLMGLQFPNAVGLAAGFDKNGDYIDALAQLGFGFIEIGTVTPRPQAGNPKPRLFRLPEQDAIINRMGFNNKGMDYVAKHLEQTKYRGILGINIGKNKDTPDIQASDDYLQAFRTLWPYASYITINISSPNTPGLRSLQHGDQLEKLICVLKQEQHSVQLNHKRYVPLVVKIAPDLSDDELAALAQVILKEKIDAVIATNTTLSRQGVESSTFAKEAGGLSGKPLQALSTRIIKQLASHLNSQIPIIASGGVMDAASAQEKIAAGASLVQVYSGLIYAGPGMIKEINAAVTVS
jgi:dihydroorotate dehydrogenase